MSPGTYYLLLAGSHLAAFLGGVVLMMLLKP